MVLLAILIVIVLLQHWGSGGPIQQDHWYQAWRGKLVTWLEITPGSGVHLLLSVVLPVVAVILLEISASKSLWGLLDLVLSVLVLLYSLGRGDLAHDVANYVQRWERGDTEAILDALMESGEVPPPADSAADIHRVARRRLYTRGFERFFAVLFWFVLAGPAGALFYRLVRLYPSVGDQGMRERILHLLDWVPARLEAAGFALIGDFERSSPVVVDRLWHFDARADDILQDCGNAALRIEADDMQFDSDEQRLRARHQLEAIELLYRRSMLLWVAAIGILQIAF